MMQQHMGISEEMKRPNRAEHSNADVKGEELHVGKLEKA